MSAQGLLPLEVYFGPQYGPEIAEAAQHLLDLAKEADGKAACIIGFAGDDGSGLGVHEALHIDGVAEYLAGLCASVMASLAQDVPPSHWMYLSNLFAEQFAERTDPARAYMLGSRLNRAAGEPC